MKLRKTLVLTVLSLAFLASNIGTNSALAHSLTKIQVDSLKHKMIVSKHTIHWYHHRGRWTLHRNFPTCKAVARRYSNKRARICYHARVTLERHTERYNRIHDILYPKPVIPAGRQMHVLVTAYCLSGTMADGNSVHWGAIATDPSLIPLGSRVYVPGYGSAVAEDTGGAVVGAHIDEWRPSCADAMRSTRYETITIY